MSLLPMWSVRSVTHLPVRSVWRGRAVPGGVRDGEVWVGEVRIYRPSRLIGSVGGSGFSGTEKHPRRREGGGRLVGFGYQAPEPANGLRL
jgi:hypothetical protein